MDLQDVQALVKDYSATLSTQFQRLPGSAIIVRYIKNSYQNDPIRSAIELILFLFALKYLLSPSYSMQRGGQVELTDEEIDEQIEDWQPEPLVAELTEEEQHELERRPTIVGPTGPKVKLSNGRTVTNLASNNVFNFIGNDLLKERAIATLRYYGVGACGPPGFYGTKDVDMKAEADIANFIGVPDCIIYSQAFSTISSVIPAFSKRGDIIVADKSVNYAIRKGIEISRSTVYWYEHNNLEDLERVLADVEKTQKRKKKLTRRFIVTEGLFEKSGDIVDLPKIVELKYKYKFRLILDETWSFLTLGRTGRGLTEHLNVDPNEIDMIVGSLANSMCTGGGFCCGSKEIVDHQRISGAAYVFSAALPAIISTTISEIVGIMKANPEMLIALRENISIFRAAVEKSDGILECVSDIANPVVMIRVKPDYLREKGLEDGEDRLLQDIVDEVQAGGFLITRVKTVGNSQSEKKAKVVNGKVKKDSDEGHFMPCLKVYITVAHGKKDLERAGALVRSSATKVLGRKK
ncbi:serine palmitoyl CoA transferase subunit LcbA [Ascobolus immersus RN42]|uniref:serine C-palmitoyltransferase n=1 Tax=Ascobolus immersus RN42 TaxID=1160509 RepID=A0A3N4IGF1_ASCIM|nr:serine palmitoyl CoA transferase subunit LcbA [Ascobolus immersus RN42]